MQNRTPRPCPDCDASLTRRDFVRTLGGAAAVAMTPGLFPHVAWSAPKSTSAAETAAGRLFESLSESQRKEIAFPFEHQLRHKISANWHVTKPRIKDDFYSNEQRKLIDEIVRGVSSEEGYDLLTRQMQADSGGIGQYSIAVFGEPGSGQFEWLLTGRHLTLRADGDSVANTAFGGPIIYGHGESNPEKNLFHYQTKKANEVFAALDPKQRERALLDIAPQENEVPLQGDGGEFPGIAVGELSSDQKDLVEQVVKVILAPYRTEDVEEALALLKAGGGFEKLHLSFYKEGDLKDDQVWDIWRVEGPTFVWHFRGAPHVHTYVNIGRKA